MPNLRVELFLGLRYFRPKRNAESLILLISVIGVCLGVAVLIIVLSVMTGFTDIMKRKLIDTGAHIQIFDFGRGYIESPDEIINIAKGCGIKDAVPITIHQALIQKNNAFYPKTIIGAPELKNSTVLRKLKKAIKYGRLSLEKNETVIGEALANRLNLYIGDKIIVHSAQKLAHLVKTDKNGKLIINKNAEVYLPSEFIVKGIFSFGKYDFDKNVMFVNLDDADDLFGLPWQSATAIYVWTKDPFNMQDTMKRLRKVIPPEFSVYSWKQLNNKLLEVLTVEKNMMFFLLIFIVLVAAFSITNTLITTVVRKTREIGILKAVGASSGTISRIFILQGLLVGILGTGTGVILGITVIKWRNVIMHTVSKVTGIELFPKEFYFFNQLPASIVPHDIILISIIAIILCTLGAVLPALRAAQLDPAKALRYE